MKLIACHLLNDYSGSPKVLKQLVNGWTQNGIEVHLVTCKGRDGFLSNMNKVNYHFFWYKWSANPFVRLINYFLSQVFLFIKIMKMASKDDIIYVNTVLPFGAALAGRLLKCKVIYHVHEVSMKPKILKWFLFKMVKTCANKVIVVSNYLAIQLKDLTDTCKVLPNALDSTFLDTAMKSKKVSANYSNVLMVASLKVYKGVNEFVELAKLNEHFNFKLVVNAGQEEINVFFKNIQLPKNLLVFPTQTNTHPFYEWADIVLNLSRTNAWIETFGLTVIEAIAYKLPVIVPPVGGIAELVIENENGYLVDSKNLNLLSERLNFLLKNKSLYDRLSAASFQRKTLFLESEFIVKSIRILREVNPKIGL